MSKLPLAVQEVQSLEVVTNPFDLRRDLHKYIQYVSGRKIKRAYRTNELPPADVKRLFQLLRLDKLPANDNSGYRWLDYIERVARKLEFVSYNTKGTYRGYSSTEPSYPDNFIDFKAANYQKFITLPLIQQERRLFDLLVGDYESSHNEFFDTTALSRLDRFPMFGSAVGVMPTLRFSQIRQILFDLLKNCESGEWYSTASLIAYLKANHPYFLIPKNPQVKQWGRMEGRYSNFYEDRFGGGQTIAEDAPEGFERVEGRYTERFLEGIPLTLGYAEVAYGTRKPNTYPSRGELQAFRLTERFFQAMQNIIPEPKVVVQPTFEIYVESAFYPAELLNRLALLADITKEDKAITIFKLQKQKVATQAAEKEGFDAVATLQKLAGRALPQNVVYELREWASRADVFTIYEGFGLLESSGTFPAVGELLMAEKISDNLSLVRWPEEVLRRLRAAGEVVINVQHELGSLQPLPEKAHTLFPRRSVEAAAKPQAPPRKQAVTIKQETLMALSFPSDELFDQFRKALLEEHCALEAHKEKRQLILSSSYQSQVQQVIEKLSEGYAIRLENS